MATLIVMARDLAERLYTGSHWPVTGSATGGDTTSLIDTTALTYSSGDPNAWDRKWVYRETTPSDTVTSTRVIEAGYAASTGDLTLSPTLSSSFASGNNYIITDEHIDVLKNALDLVNINIFLPTFFPLSLHIMGNDANDMEPSTITTDYAAENSGTLTTESTIVFNRAQSLKVTAGAALSGASTGNISVYENKPYYAAVMCSVQQGDDADFRVVNVQDSDAQINDNATTDEPSWTELVIPFTPPTGCEQVDVFMLGKANGDIAYYEDFQVWPAGNGVYSLPSWITRPQQLLDIRVFPQGAGGPASDFDYRSNERQSQPLRWGFERIDQRATSELQVWVEGTQRMRPFIHALRPLPTLSSDTTNTVAEQDFVVSWAARYMEAVTAREKSDILAHLRSIYFARPVRRSQPRVAVRG